MVEKRLYVHRQKILLFILFLAFGLRLCGILSIPPIEDNILHDFPSARQISLNPNNLSIPLIDTESSESSPMAWKYLIRIGWYVFGDSTLGATLPFIFLGVGTIFMVYLFVSSALGVTIALFVSFLLAISSGYIGITRIAIDKAVYCFFSMLSIFVLHKAVFESRRRLFLLNGLVIGVSFWFYEWSFLLVPIIVVFLFVMPQYQHWLKDKYLWGSFLLAFIVMLPLIILNFSPEASRFVYAANRLHFGPSINALGLYLGELILLIAKPFPEVFSNFAYYIEGGPPFINFILGIIILIASLRYLRDRRPFIRLMNVVFLFNFVVFSFVGSFSRSWVSLKLDATDWVFMGVIPGVVLAANMLVEFMRRYKLKAVFLTGILIFYIIFRTADMVSYPLNYFPPTRDYFIKRLLVSNNSWVTKHHFLDDANKEEVRGVHKEILSRIYRFYNNNKFYREMAKLRLNQLLTEQESAGKN